MARVLLVHPNEDITGTEKKMPLFTPLSLIYLGTAIEDRHEVKIYDRNLYPDNQRFIRFFKKYNPDIVGFTSAVSTMLFDLIYLGKLVKKISPKTIIIVGGVQATVDPDSILNEPYVDYILRGEGEEAFLEFCDAFDKNPKKLSKIKNINKNPLRPFLDMDKLKLPNYDLIEIDKYEEFYISLSRGCIGSCTFCYNCQMWGKNGKPFVRSYSTEKSIALFKKIIEKYKRSVFFIIDDNFLFFKKRCIEVCNFLKDYNVHFYTSGRADSLDDEILSALKKAGCHTVLVGIESGSQKILDLLNKGTTVEQNIRAIKLCKKHKIMCNASIMIGLPTETAEDLQETMDLIKIYKPDVPNVHIYNPLPAKLFDYCISKGMIKKPKTLEEWASFGGVWRTKKRVSEIPDREITKAINESRRFMLLRRKFKKLIFWIKTGEVSYTAKSIKRNLADLINNLHFRKITS